MSTQPNLLCGLLLALFGTAHAQSTALIGFAGGSASNAQTTVSWSAGELVVLTAENDTHAATQGLQQPLETTDMEEDTSTVIPVGTTVNVITPNGDGTNDLFIITGVENAPNNRLVICNRWREVVYWTEGYQNDWQGTDRNNRPLPQAAYYYTYFSDKNNISKNNTLRGTIHVLRDKP